MVFNIDESLLEGRKSLFTKLLILNYRIYPFLVTFTFSVLLVESFTYAGFVGKYIIFGANFFLLLSILSGIIQLAYSSQFEGRDNENYLFQNKIFFYFCNITLPVFVFLYYVVIVTEAKNYPNYVFSTIHLNIENFSYVVFFNLFNVFLGQVKEYKKLFFQVDKTFKAGKTFEVGKTFRIKKTINTFWLNKVLISALITLMFFFGATNLLQTGKQLIVENIYIFLNRSSSYDEKMEAKWGLFYKYMKFVRDNTPNDAAIAIPPPVRPWLSEGNSVLVRYFLYPRFLITVENEFITERKPDYYLLAKGLWKAYDDKDYGWPKDFIKAEKILYMDSETNIAREVEKDYDPSEPKNLQSWGLIKAKY